MSSLIKASSEPACTILSFGRAQQEAPSLALSRETELELRINALELEVQEAERRLPELLDQARKEGAEKALIERSDAEAKNLECLGRGLGEALSLWSERLSSLEGFAATLSRSILEQVFTEDAGRADALTSAINRRLASLDGQKLICLRVSGEDFSSAEALETLAAGLDDRPIIQADNDLKSGECVFDLKLGHIDVGPAAQWPRIAEFLDRVEQEGLGD